MHTPFEMYVELYAGNPGDIMINRLNEGIIKKLTGKKGFKPGWHGDGGNLYLQVTPERYVSWIFRYTREGKARVLGLGPLHTVSLAEARERARKHRLMLLDGLDPAGDRTPRLIWTFQEAAASCHKLLKPTIANAKHYAAWLSLVTRNCEPFLATPVRDVTAEQLIRVLKPIWAEKKGARLRERLEKIFDHAIARGQRAGTNPAMLKGPQGLLHALGPCPRKRSGRQHASIPHTQIAGYVARLRARNLDVAALALEFTILTATSTGDIRGGAEDNKPPMLWAHVDEAARTWTIPCTKIDKALVVPLSDAAWAVLERVRALGLDAGIVFASAMARQAPIGADAMRLVAQELDKNATPHGFRATFATWAAEETTFEKGVVEVSMRHHWDTDEVRATYMRGALLKKRAILMQAWADYIAGASNVVALVA